jgi:hypothetical protein
MEGVVLHPVEDHRGVNRFDPDEVERVARSGTTPMRAKAQRLTNAKWSEDDDGANPTQQDAVASESALRARIAELELETARERMRVIGVRQELARAERAIADLRERLNAFADLLLEALSPSQLEALGDEGVMLLGSMLQAD